MWTKDALDALVNAEKLAMNQQADQEINFSQQQIFALRCLKEYLKIDFLKSLENSSFLAGYDDEELEEFVEDVVKTFNSSIFIIQAILNNEISKIIPVLQIQASSLGILMLVNILLHK
jgi:hypothetical protein